MPGVLMTKNFKLCNIGEVDNKFGFQADYKSLSDVLTSERFQTDMNNRYLFGFISHEIRKRIEDTSKSLRLPYVDVALNSGEISNILHSCHFREDPDTKEIQFIGKIDILDTPKGREIASAIEAGTKIKLSISTIANPTGGKWNFKMIRGADFTTLPAFQTEEVPMDFSSMELEGGQVQIPLEGELESYLPIDPESDEVSTDFSGIRDYILEHTRSPRQVFQKRYQEVSRYLQSTSPAKVKSMYSHLTMYLREYILQWINRAIAEPNGTMSIALGLGLSSILDANGMKAARELQRVLVRIRSALNSTGAMNASMQKNLSESFENLMNSLMNQLLDKAPKAKAVIKPTTMINPNPQGV